MKRILLPLVLTLWTFAANGQSCPDDNHPHMIDLGLPSGTLWSCCNVGADKPEAYGGYYAWGETEEKATYDWSTYVHCEGSWQTSYDLGMNIIGTPYDVAHVKWGGKWQMPSMDQIWELGSCVTFQWKTINGVEGCLLIGPNGETIFLPAAGAYGLYGNNNYYSGCFYYWSGNESGNFYHNKAKILKSFINAQYFEGDNDCDRCSGLPIRPVTIKGFRNITVILPEGTDTQAYAHMWLELNNTKSDQHIHYVMTDRKVYTFPNIYQYTTWNIVLRNERGDVFGQINNVEVNGEDVTVTFAELSKPQNVSISVITPNGQDVTNNTRITWTDALGNYMAQGSTLSGLPVGYKVHYSVVLSQELATAYNAPLAIDYMLKNGDNDLTCQLEAIKQTQIFGKVYDSSTRQPLNGATVSASQTFGGRYDKTQNVKTDRNGYYTLDLACVPTSMVFASPDYVSKTLNYDSLMNGETSVSLPDVLLDSITGATISIDFSYTACHDDNMEVEKQNWYGDYQNMSFELFNVTKNHAISQYNVQFPQIVLLEDVVDGDVLKLTAFSRTNAFMPVTCSVTIAEQRAVASFAITELGKIQASYTKTSNASVVGSLYDSYGKLVNTYNYSEASLTINDLVDGSYILVSMGSSQLYNTIYDLAQLPQTGLEVGKDYVQNLVDVRSGVISKVVIPEVPTLDESKLYYTGENTSFTVNKPSIVVGNYLTLTGRIDFKPAYSLSVSNVQLVVDLPESCQFVDNSVMVGNNPSYCLLNGHQVIIPMTSYTDRVRLCVIPIQGGVFAPNAFVQFDLNGETIKQPIGSAYYSAKDLSISVPSIVAKNIIPLSGTAIGKSSIVIYDNNVVVGQTTSLANGSWATTIEFDNDYKLSNHKIFVKSKTTNGLELFSETKNVLYDPNAIQIEKVTMYYSNPEINKNYEIIYNFLNPSTTPHCYIYYIYNRKFTFTVNFTNNDTTKISNVVLYVKTGDNNWHALKTIFDENKNNWIAVGEFGNMYDGIVPVNVRVKYDLYDANSLEVETIVDAISNDLGSPHYSYGQIGDGMYTSEIVSEDHGIDLLCFKLIRNLNQEDNVYEKIRETNFSKVFDFGHYEYYENEIASLLVQHSEDSICVFTIFEKKDESLFNEYVSAFSDIEYKVNKNRVVESYKIANSNTWPEGNRLQQLIVDRYIRPWIDMAKRKYECTGDPMLIACIDRLRASFGARVQGLLANYYNIMQNAGRPDGRLDALNSLYGGGSAAYDISEQLESMQGLQESDKWAMDYIWNAEEDCSPPGGDGSDGEDSGYPDNDVPIDPSGYVYEGVTSNRLEGVTATAYYKENIEDMYGDLHENIVKWDAEEYCQQNPLFTDEYGMYRWDVPQGLWQVKFEKEGYETTYSEWLPVPPPQLDINIPMRQYVQPNVKMAHAYEDAVEVEFDKYMMPELLTAENIMVSQSGQPVEGNLVILNIEPSSEGSEESFASKVRFNASKPFTEQEVTLMVRNRVKSYMGINMQDDFSQTFAVEFEIKNIVCDSLVELYYGENATLMVSVLPALASRGKVLNVKSSSPLILGVDTEQVTIGDDGTAAFTVSGELPGTAALTFSVDGTDKTAITIVNIEQFMFKTVATPTASLASGTTLDKGMEVYLYCETEGATIYYTVDGSCPCDEETRHIYNGPISIMENVVIKAIAVKEGMDDSDVATFIYTVKGTSVRGDVNGDGVVTITDVAMMVAYIMGEHDKDFILANADMNNDNDITITDVAEIVSLILDGTSHEHSIFNCPDSNHPHMIDLGLPSGTKWACCNVGATTPDEKGGYYAWGETVEKVVYDWNSYIHCDGGSNNCHDLGNDIAGTQYDVAHFQWGGNWVMPSLSQMDELVNNCTYSWTSLGDVNGGKFTGLNGESIFLPAAGYHWINEFYNNGSDGNYWSSSQDSGHSYDADGLVFSSWTIFDSEWDLYTSNRRFSGRSVRPVYSETPPIVLILSSTSIEVTAGESSTVEITSGSGSYEVTSSNTSVATASLSGSTITISGKSAGTAVVTVRDTATGKTQTVSVTVYKKLILSSTSVEVTEGESFTVEITSGSGSYEVTSSNTSVATASLSGSTITISGKSAGTAVVTVKDKSTGNTAVISVTVTARIPSYLSCPDSNHPHMIDLGLPSGTKWACCNVGATKPEGYGGYYAWGETNEKSYYYWSTYQYCDGTQETCYDLGADIAGTEYDVAHVKWGGSWVMSSLKNYNELRNNCSYTWTTKNGVKGGLFTGPSGGTIFLPAAGWRYYGSLESAGSSGRYGMSNLYISDVYFYLVYYFYFSSYNPQFGNNMGRDAGLTVRPVSK